jgi:hypothetical protein
MRRPLAWLLGLTAVLVLGVSVQVARLVERHVQARHKLGGSTFASLAPGTRAFLDTLRGDVSLTFFASDRRVVPARAKDVEPAVRALLMALQQAAPARVSWRVLDPDLDPHGRGYASRKGVAPIKVRRVQQDESSEVSVWSSLVIEHARYPDVLVHEVGPADLPYLERLVVESLKAGAEPVRPVVAVAAPERGYQQVRTLIAQLTGARVVSIDFDRAPPIPADADLFVWIDPARAGPDHARALERFLANGRSAIVAGSGYAIDYTLREGAAAVYRARRSPCDWDGLLQPFGLGMAPMLLMDQRRHAIAWRDAGGVGVEAPFHLQIAPSLFDTSGFFGPNAGMLVAPAASPVSIDPELVARSDRRASVIATTSEHARLCALPDGEFDDAVWDAARPVAKQPWLVRLEPTDRWRGELVLASSPGLFRDELYEAGGNANANFLRTLLRTYTDPPRLARQRVPRVVPPPVPELSAFARIAWRGITVLLLPAAVLLLALRSGRSRSARPRGVPWRRPALVGAACLGIVWMAGRFWPDALDPRADLTADRVNTPSPATRRIVDAAGPGLAVELFASHPIDMPSAWKDHERRILRALRSLGIAPRVVRPDELPAAEQANLRDAGIAPFEVDAVGDDVRIRTRILCALRLARDGRTEVVPRIDARAVQHLEFLLAAAAERLAGRRAPRVGVLSDLPRLSPAEAYEYQQKQQTAPVGSDVYSRVKQLCGDYGYDTVYVNPEATALPADLDVLVWLQPRFPQRLLPAFSEFLARGGKAFVALQHYNVQQRQYRGGGFETVYWPQPQFHRFNEYLELCGVRQIGENFGKDNPGEVLLDRQHADLVLTTQVNRSAWRELDAQQVARPFLIRAAGAGLSRESVITERLGALLFAWGSRFSFDDRTLASHGIARSVLVSTSPRAWHYPWSGGWIPDEAMREPDTFLPGPQPLAVLLEGRFPRVALGDDANGRAALSVVPDGPASEPGQLFLVGCSEMFKDANLTLPEFQHAQLLLNGVAFLAHGPELAAIQARTRVPRALPYQPADVKVLWRTLVLGVPVALFLLYGLLHRRWRRRPIFAVAEARS